MRANDWKDMDARKLLQRLYLDGWYSEQHLQEVGDLISPLEYHGSLHGRLALVPSVMVEEHSVAEIGDAYLSPTRASMKAVVVVGGVRSETYLTDSAGLLLGKSLKAARDLAHPLIPAEACGSWATLQVDNLPRLKSGTRENDRLLALAIELWGNPGVNPIADSAEGSLTYDEIVNFSRGHTEIFILQDASWGLLKGRKKGAELNSNVLVTHTGRSGALGMAGAFDRGNGILMSWTMSGKFFAANSVVGWVEKAIAEGWGTSRDAIEPSGEAADRSSLCEVGTWNGKMIRLSAYRVERPQGA